MNQEYTHKAQINLSFVDGKEMWYLVHSPTNKYSASRVDTGTVMKYFNNGITLMRAKDFRKEYREQSIFEPLTNWVLLVSLSGSLPPDGKSLVRKRNRTSLVLSCTLDSISEKGQFWPDPGLALDPQIIQYNTAGINYKSGKATINCRLPQGIELKETPFMYTDMFKRLFAKFTTELEQFNTMTNVDHFVTKESEDVLVETLMRVATQMGFQRPTAAPARARIASWFATGDDPNAYVRKGVAFINEKEFNDLMSTRDNNEELVLRFKYELPILEKLMDLHRDDEYARLKKVDLMQLQSKMYISEPFIDYRIGLSNEEWDQHRKEWYEAKEQHAEQFVEEKWRELVIQRWKTLQ